jgi:hypothetical protein
MTAFLYRLDDLFVPVDFRFWPGLNNATKDGALRVVLRLR